MNDLIQATKQAIAQAFSGVSYPTGKAVVSDADGPALVNHFTGKAWRDVSAEVLTHSSLYFFTREGFQFFLPAFLLASLDEENAELRGRVVRALAPAEPVDAAREAAFQERVSLLSAAQRAAVRAFLTVVVERHADEFTRTPPALARDGLWLGSAAEPSPQ